MYDFFFDTVKDTWRLWTELIDTKPIPADAKFRCGCYGALALQRSLYDLVGSCKVLSRGSAECHIRPLLCTVCTCRRIIIPSIDTVRYTYLLDKGITHSQPVLICGPTGTGAAHSTGSLESD